MLERALMVTMSSDAVGELFDAICDDGTGVEGAADDEDGILASERSEDLRPFFVIDRFGDGLCAARKRVEHDQFRYSIDT